jgi:hypothetical protein
MGFLLLLRDLRRRRRDPALTALALAFFFSAMSYVVSINPVWVAIGNATHSANLSVPLAQGCVVLVFALQATVIAYWTKPPAAAAHRARILFVLAAVVIVAMAVLFAFLTPTTPRPVDFSQYYAHVPVFQAYQYLYMGVYTVAEIYLAQMCLRYAREVGEPWIARGLYLIATGAVITLGYSGIRLSAAIGAEAGFGVDSLNPYAWLCGDVGGALTQIGYFLPIIVTRVKAVTGWFREHRQYQRLHDLWQAVTEAEPSVVLVAPLDPDEASRHSVAFDLYRRAVEIRDGQIELRPYLDPAVRTEAELRRRAWWRSNARTVAAVTADQIQGALAQRRHGTVDEPTTYADAALDTPTTGKDLRHLARVAAYFTPGTPTAQQKIGTTARR